MQYVMWVGAFVGCICRC